MDKLKQMMPNFVSSLEIFVNLSAEEGEIMKKFEIKEDVIDIDNYIERNNIKRNINIKKIGEFVVLMQHSFDVIKQ